jgi:hypothetical protein
MNSNLQVANVKWCKQMVGLKLYGNVRRVRIKWERCIDCKWTKEIKLQSTFSGSMKNEVWSMWRTADSIHSSDNNDFCNSTVNLICDGRRARWEKLMEVIDAILVIWEWAAPRIPFQLRRVLIRRTGEFAENKNSVFLNISQLFCELHEELSQYFRRGIFAFDYSLRNKNCRYRK